MSLLLPQGSNFPIPCLRLCTRPGHGKLFVEQAWRWVEPDGGLCPHGPRGRNGEPIALAGPGREGVAWPPGCPGRAHPLASEELLPISDPAPPRASRASERQHLCQGAVSQGDTSVSPPSSTPCLWWLQAGQSSVTVASTSLSQEALLVSPL